MGLGAKPEVQLHRKLREVSRSKSRSATESRVFEKPPLKPLSLTIFFPCYNEEGNVESMTRKALEVGRRLMEFRVEVTVNAIKAAMERN